jgi:DNA repair protein RadA/Sms
MAKTKLKYVCRACGYESLKWLGKCPSCGDWNSFEEEVQRPQRTASGLGASGLGGADFGSNQPLPITEVETANEPRIVTKLGEWNRVLGGGIVPGSLILVGGDPGIGKSTLLLQTSHALAEMGLKVLYVSGEESIRQTRLRADRLQALSGKMFVLCETNVEAIELAIAKVQPDLLIIDSIQTVYHPEADSAPGSVVQVRECTNRFMHIAKMRHIATVLVGHVTKEGAIAGPRMLEHMVDCVLYFEGERHHSYRILRAVKNRFGSTNEIGIFEMRESGLVEVLNPSELFLAQRPKGVSGSVVVASLEGTRPILVELQALVSATSFAAPRRMATGVDLQRVNLIIAVLEKRVGILLQAQDAYLNVAGGVKLDEPAIDLAIAVSLVSSFRDRPTKADDVVFGEIGLTGEVRGVSRIEQRLREAQKLGFKRAIVPQQSMKGLQAPAGIEVIGVETIADALRHIFEE